jgi:hypothetical protein
MFFLHSLVVFSCALMLTVVVGTVDGRQQPVLFVAQQYLFSDVASNLNNNNFGVSDTFVVFVVLFGGNSHFRSYHLHEISQRRY